jgi:hypothetical protein
MQILVDVVLNVYVYFTFYIKNLGQVIIGTSETLARAGKKRWGWVRFFASG